jgi:hypothetical protein
LYDNNFYFTLYHTQDMATSWEDLFKFNTELLTDDYNKGQALVVKTKAKSDDNVTVSIMKILLFLKKANLRVIHGILFTIVI